MALDVTPTNTGSVVITALIILVHFIQHAVQLHA